MKFWPGDKISYLPDEMRLDPNFIFAKKVGVVQTVSQERIARVRWYENPSLEINTYSKGIGSPISHFGPIATNITDVSIYEIAAHPRLEISRGDMVFALPMSPQPSASDRKLYERRCDQYASNGAEFEPDEDGDPMLDLEEDRLRLFDDAMRRIDSLRAVRKYHNCPQSVQSWISPLLRTNGLRRLAENTSRRIGFNKCSAYKTPLQEAPKAQGESSSIVSTRQRSWIGDGACFLVKSLIFAGTATLSSVLELPKMLVNARCTLIMWWSSRQAILFQMMTQSGRKRRVTQPRIKTSDEDDGRVSNDSTDGMSFKSLLP